MGCVKNTIPRQLRTHKDCRQDFRKNWKYLYAAVWRKSVKGNVLNNLGQLCAWKEKGTFRRNPRRTKLLFRACKTLDFPLLKWPFQGICTRNLFQKFISEIQKCINYYSFGHFPHRPCLVWCHHRHGLLQVLLPCFWRVWTGSIPIFFCSRKFRQVKVCWDWLLVFIFVYWYLLVLEHPVSRGIMSQWGYSSTSEQGRT